MRLCDLLKRYRLGVKMRTRVEEDVIVNAVFFDEYQRTVETNRCCFTLLICQVASR